MFVSLSSCSSNVSTNVNETTATSRKNEEQIVTAVVKRIGSFIQPQSHSASSMTVIVFENGHCYSVVDSKCPEITTLREGDKVTYKTDSRNKSSFTLIEIVYE